MTNPRDLIQRLADSIELLLEMRPVNARPMAITEARLAEARAYLATPKPAAGPTRRQIMMLAADMELGDLDGGTRLVLEAFRRWGHQPLQPIQLSERLPGPEDCDAEGCIWMWNGHWVRLKSEAASLHSWAGSYWLPYHAIPLPLTP